ncbi:hypothetical protein [Acinetobacter baumannii]|uniref:hypothetical protein n=1 Tax=Acinetobacter baumannii TaxID=470 RepID=UPI00208F9EE5|nr:hypothetical protein [Acinetobacter baumannii]MDP7762335.1 hypothetical protein [Acinetobacter baumannii]
MNKTKGCLIANFATVPFEALTKLSLKFPNDFEWPLVLNRLYKKYVLYEDINKTKEIMDFCKSKLTEPSENENTNIFLKYFRQFDSAVESAIYFYEYFNDYVPVRIAVVDLPWQMVEARRPLREYDQLEGVPYWLTDYSWEEMERLGNL